MRKVLYNKEVRVALKSSQLCRESSLEKTNDIESGFEKQPTLQRTVLEVTK